MVPPGTEKEEKTCLWKEEEKALKGCTGRTEVRDAVISDHI
jgi:hypothetical protein